MVDDVRASRCRLHDDQAMDDVQGELLSGHPAKGAEQSALMQPAGAVDAGHPDEQAVDAGGGQGRCGQCRQRCGGVWWWLDMDVR